MNLKQARDVNDDKLYRLCRTKLTGDDLVIYSSFIMKLVGLAKQSGMGFLIENTQANWMNIVEYHDLEIEDTRGNLSTGLDMAHSLLHWSDESPMVDFDDLLYLAVKENLSLQKFDFVFVDEAQDTNAIQRALLRKLFHQRTRLMAVGDPAQAIYGFRGADSNSLDRIAEEFNCTRLPLSVTYRCPTKVVDYAHKWVDHIQPAPGAPEGAVHELGEKWEPYIFKPLDLVVCRTTKPLVALAFKMIRQRLPVYVMGSEIGKSLKGLIRKLNANTLEHLHARLQEWETMEVQKAAAKHQDAKIANIQDKAETIYCLIDSMEGSETVDDLYQIIDQMFQNRADATVLATIHKSKGLEADRVFWLNSSQCPSKWAKQPWQQQQERNLCYVATTRAKKELFLIEEEK